MKYLTVLHDTVFLTVLYLIRAGREKDAFNKIATQIIGAEKTAEGKWYHEDPKNPGKNIYCDDVHELVRANMIFRAERKIHLVIEDIRSG